MKKQTLCLCQCLVPYISLMDKTQNFGTKALMSEQKTHTHHKIKGKNPRFYMSIKAPITHSNADKTIQLINVKPKIMWTK